MKRGHAVAIGHGHLADEGVHGRCLEDELSRIQCFDGDGIMTVELHGLANRVSRGLVPTGDEEFGTNGVRRHESLR